MTTEKDAHYLPEDDQPDVEQTTDQGHTEQEKVPLTLEEELMELATELGFIETEQLRQLRETVSPLLPEADSLQLIVEYQNLAREATQSPVDASDPGDQLGVLIAEAAVVYRSGRAEDARSELETAQLYAINLGDLPLSEYLQSILDDLVE
ncbi:hypothetical protein H3C70_02290 [Patescibacteria group bacterium]|nr:hypothetical protein [Patescibacteria group bacterium]